MKFISPRKLAGCMGVIIVALGATILWLTFEFGYLPSRSFDAEGWKQLEQVEGYPRLAMVDSLIESRKLEGKTQDDILALLGPPTDTSYFSDWDAVYWLGPERGWLRLDSEWLVLRFDDKGRVFEYQLVRD